MHFKDSSDNLGYRGRSKVTISLHSYEFILNALPNKGRNVEGRNLKKKS